MKVEELLEQIDEMLDNAWNIPLSGGKCAVEAEKLRDILDDIRGNLPSELRQAQNIVQDRSDIIEKARQEAENIVRTAEERARSIVAHDELVLQAQQKANEMLTQAQQKSREMRKGAYDFADDLLRRTEETLAGRLSEARAARQQLRQPAQPQQQPPQQNQQTK
ncbi:MAG: ATPase [Clostridia bacterium]|nr:ATPase [Clostridia bacterium]MBR7092167.1 ATPase [Clostridia bacterium]